MKNFVKIFLLLIMMSHTSLLFAQDKKVEMADMMRSNGKIYIVVAVCLTILIGLFIYVWNVDRKIGKIEKEVNGQ
jgi:ABC-type amino acid transport system permease subunit